MRFLVIGSTLEAAMACELLSGVTGVERVWSLPSKGPGHAVVSAAVSTPSAWRECPTRSVERAVLRDQWGKHLMGHRLEGYRTLSIKEASRHLAGPLETLDPNVGLVRARPSPDGVTCQMSDGTELACTGVLFADGARSKARELMGRLSKPRLDRLGVACWSFLRPDLLDLKVWEFRSALGKSVEQLPLPEDLVRVKLRFRTTSAARQTVPELKALFSEFGSDMEALFDGVDSADISYWQEEDPGEVAFSPVPGCLALGEAALGVPILGTFDWGGRLARRQLDRVVESVVAEHWDPSAFEPACQDALRPLLRSERFLRDALHYDNALLRPLRDLAIRFVPAGVLVERIKQRLSF